MRLLNTLKVKLRQWLPAPLVQIRARQVQRRLRKQMESLSVQQAFENVYARNIWGGEVGDFYSGDGSDEKNAAAYVAFVRDFVQSHNVRSIADLGCGDFRVGRRLVGEGVKYIGVDIVQPLIERNQQMFGGPNVEFHHRNLIDDPLPPAELGLIRQVLQHLANEQIEKILKNCRHYKYLLVTEHLPTGADVRPNLDKPHGNDVRTVIRSGVYLEKPPFSRSAVTLLEVPYYGTDVLRTSLIDNGAHSDS